MTTCETRVDTERLFEFIVTLGIASAVLRLLLLGAPELLQEEAYYWNYAIHLAPGYLDHPPLNAWLIALGTAIFGLNEFGVRFGSYLCGFITIYFVYRLALVLAGKRVAVLSAAIMSALPYGMGNFFYISPDAGVAAAWAAALYFIVLIIRSDPKDERLWGVWLALGAAFGLGLLSKYSIAILAFSALLVFLSVSKLRIWFIRPQPYFAVLLTVILFSPVIYWNATHEWASLVFQGSRRFAEEPRFSFHDFLGQFLVIGTPLGCWVALLFCFGRLGEKGSVISDPVLRFLMLSFAVPTAIFALYSIRHMPRLNWTGPAFAGVIPIFAQHVLGEIGTRVRCAALWQRSWSYFLAFSVAAFTVLWVYWGLGIPGTGYSKKMGKFIGWEDLAAQIFAVSQIEEKSGGKKPFVLGMDKHYTAAELSFYLRRAGQLTGKESPPVAGRALVGLPALMFQFWIPAGDLTGRPAILVSRNRGDLEFPEVSANFGELGPITEYRGHRNGKPVGYYYFRTARDYKGLKNRSDSAE